MAEERICRLAALDMDGTLLNSEHTTSDYTRAVIRRAAAAGNVVALSTGRCLSELWAHLKQLPEITYIIGENGACLYDVRNRRSLQQMVIDGAHIKRVFELIRPYRVLPQAFIDNQSYIGFVEPAALIPFGLDPYLSVFQSGSILRTDIEDVCLTRAGHVEKLNLYFEFPDEADIFREQARDLAIAMKGTLTYGWELSPAGATKGDGLRALCRLLNIPIEQSLAVGDSGNDLDMLAAAGVSVAMGNASEEVKDAAHYVTEDCDHDGCAKAMERFMAL